MTKTFSDKTSENLVNDVMQWLTERKITDFKLSARMRGTIDINPTYCIKQEQDYVHCTEYAEILARTFGAKDDIKEFPNIASAIEDIYGRMASSRSYGAEITFTIVLDDFDSNKESDMQALDKLTDHICDVFYDHVMNGSDDFYEEDSKISSFFDYYGTTQNTLLAFVNNILPKWDRVRQDILDNGTPEQIESYKNEFVRKPHFVKHNLGRACMSDSVTIVVKEKGKQLYSKTFDMLEKNPDWKEKNCYTYYIDHKPAIKEELEKLYDLQLKNKDVEYSLDFKPTTLNSSDYSGEDAGVENVDAFEDFTPKTIDDVKFFLGNLYNKFKNNKNNE